MASLRLLNHVLLRRRLIVPSTLCCFNNIPSIKSNVWYSTQKSPVKVDGKAPTNYARAVKENMLTGGYLVIIIAGIGMIVLIFRTLYKELVSSKSPNAIYGKALDRCKEHDKVLDLLGAPIKGYGEGNSRGRRNHVRCMYYIKNDVNYMKVQFYLQGTRRRGTVNVEVKENSSGDYEFSYIHVIVDYIGTIVVEDNRDNVEIQKL